MAKPDETGVTVKPLEWHERPSGFIAQTPMGEVYIIEPSWRLYIGGGYLLIGVFGSERETKAAAQAHFEARIYACLSISPTKQEETPVAWVTAGILAAMRRGKLVTPGWKYSPDFCIPLYAGSPSPSVSREAIRAEAFEEAAKICDAIADENSGGWATEETAASHDTAREIAAAIRVLSTPEHGEGTI